MAAFSTTTWAHDSGGTTHGRSSLSLNGRERLSVTGHSSFSLNSRATVLRPQGGMWWRGAGFTTHAQSATLTTHDLHQARSAAMLQRWRGPTAPSWRTATATACTATYRGLLLSLVLRP